MKALYFFAAAFLTYFPLQAQTHFEFAKQFGSPTGEFAFVVKLDGSGNIYTLGQFSGTVDFDPGPGSFNLTAAGVHDLFISKLDASGNFIWAKKLGGSGADLGYGTLTVEPSGSLYVSGHFTGTADFDPGTSVYSLTAVVPSGPFTAGDAFVLKLDASGSFEWAEQISGCLIYINTITPDNVGNIYLAGDFRCPADFDPGPGVFQLTAPNTPFAFILKLDDAGNFKWAKQTTGTASTGADNCSVSSLVLDASGNPIATGSFIGDVDFDPGTGSFVMTSVPQTTAYPPDAFVWKLDTLGNLLWAKQMGGPGANASNSLSLDAAGNILTTGTFTDVVDFDPGPLDFSLTATAALADAYILKLTASGDFVWAKAISGSYYEAMSMASLDNQGDIYLGGSFSGTADFDPGTGIANATASGYDGFVVKLDSAGNYVFSRMITGAGDENINMLQKDALDNLVACGSFSGQADFDPGPATYTLTEAGMYDAFVVKWSQDSCASLTLVADSAVSLSCATLQGHLEVHSINGHPPYSYAWNTSPIQTTPAINVSAGGIYQVTVTDNLGCSRTTDLLINGMSYPTGFDLNANMAGGLFRPGFGTHILLDAFNDGCVPQTGSLKLVLTNQIAFGSSIPAPDLISGDTLIWNFTSLTYDSPHLTPDVWLSANQTTPIGDTICLEVIMTPVSGDADVANNTKTYCSVVVGSYDPNDKSVYPAGACEERYVLTGTGLTYTVNFQNTGTSNAIDVKIIDSLDVGLDLSTLKVVGSSHPVITEILPANVMRFSFNNIQLPDSNVNEPASHGYVIYNVKPMPGLPSGTMVHNKAGIYFDFNQPVLTNTVTNEFVSVVPACNTGIRGVGNSGSFSVYPNPVCDVVTVNCSDGGRFVITDLVGKVQCSMMLKKGFRFTLVDVKGLMPGLYTYAYYPETSGKRSGKLLIVR